MEGGETEMDGSGRELLKRVHEARIEGRSDMD